MDENSELYKGNLEVIQKSLLTIVHGEYLLEYFNEPNMVYLRHGANPNTFYPNKDSDISHKLLCVGRTDQDDRKGLQLAIEAAKKCSFTTSNSSMPHNGTITIVLAVK